MNRRTLILPASAIGLACPLYADERTFYTPGMAEVAMEAGGGVILNFWTGWCSTCAAQGRVIEGLMAANPDGATKLCFVVVDWDRYGNCDLSRALSIPCRSTLVALKGRDGIARVVAGIGKAEIKALFDAALAAAG